MMTKKNRNKMPLAENIWRMTNPEIIGIAKNRFLDSDTQIAIAKHHYRRAQKYLTENPGLCTEARDILWNDRGYVTKSALITYGHYSQDPEKYHELYDTQGESMRSRSPWRLKSTFLHGHCWFSHGHTGTAPGPASTPAAILGDIYEKDVVLRRSLSLARWEISNTRFTEQCILEHPNTPTEIIVKISASSVFDDSRYKALRLLATEKHSATH